MIEVRTQAALDKALEKTNGGKDDLVVCLGDSYFTVGGSATVRAWDRATVRAGGSATVRAGGRATVRAWDRATVRAGGSATVRAGGRATVRAWDRATVRAWGRATVEAWGSATVRAGDRATVRAGDRATVRAGGRATVRAWDRATVRAWGSATVRAWGSATVRAWDSATVEAAAHTPVIKSARATGVTISGGVVIDIPVPKTAAEWCEFHQVEVEDGVAILFKALDKDFCSSWNAFSYEPGSEPKAPDWDGGDHECGGGLHFSPTPFQARCFNSTAEKFVGCPVRVKDIVVHPDGMYPEKVKAPGVCGPVFEVDIDGNRLPAGTGEAA